MALQSVMSRDGLDEITLIEIAEACHVSTDEIQDIYSCTPLQISTMAESTIRTGASVYQYVFSISPSVDIDRFCTALRKVVSLNAVLRTRLVDCRLGLVQVVTSENHCIQRRSGDVARYLGDDNAQPMNLGVPLFRSAIIEDCKLVLTMHHAISDHSSMPPFLRDVLRVYNGYAPEPHAAFKEFVAHCIGIENDVSVRSFWTSRFNGVPAVFPRVDRGYVPNATQKETRKMHLKQIGADISLVHIPSFIESAWALTAGAYTNSETVAFGLVLSGRTPILAGVETTLGPTIATIPVQVNLQRHMTVEGLLKERTMARRQLQTHPALQYGITRIRTVNEAARTASGFQTLLNIRPSLSDPSESTDLSYDYMNEPTGVFSLCLSCNLESDGIVVEAMTDPAIICQGQLRRILRQFEHTLQTLMDAPSQTKLEKLPKLNPYDHSEILHWNSTVPETLEKCVHELFRAQAQKQPQDPAVEAHDGSVSYRDLDEMSDRLAPELRRRGVSVGNPVAFIFEKSLWTVVAVLAILKAGGACVPIEKSDPQARKAAIVSAANVKTILTSSAEHANSTDLGPDVLAVNADYISGLPDVTSLFDEDISSPGDLAYIIFTSGSTGTPKGVMLEHQCLASSLTSLVQRFGWQRDCRMLQFAAHVWDISIGEMFGALLSGSCLCIPSEEARDSSLANFIDSSKVNWAWLTPTVLRTMSPNEVPGLQSLLSVGEPVDAVAADTWGKALRLFNGWGPCESSILSAAAVLTPDSPYPESIGIPLGCALWIVLPGKPNELAPIGAIGELLVEGPGVARGYLDDKHKTTASFISPPLWAPRENKSKHFYRTGDLAKYNPDGSICFIGRQDNQVKVRGQRFDLGELESVLASCGEVRDVFTTTKISQGRTELVTVICLADLELPKGTVLQEVSDVYSDITFQRLRTVRDYVGSRLPSFMVPTIWLAVEQMPRTASAKMDRTSIKEWLKTRNLSLARAALDTQMAIELTPPATIEERLLQSIWASVLAIPECNIGRQSTLVQLGGDSIQAMQIASRCRNHGLRTTTAVLLSREPLSAIAKSTTIIEPASEDLVSSKVVAQDERFSPPTATNLNASETLVSQLSQSNLHLQSENIEAIASATDVQAIMLATGQTRDKGYHVDFMLDFTPALDTARLRRACELVIQHHPILRTVFVRHGPVLYQVVLKALPPEMIIEEKEKSAPTVRFEKGMPAARFHLVVDGQFCRHLWLEIHHALYDAISLGLIFRDLDASYTSKALSDGPHFHSWVSHIEACDLYAPREFWREVLRGSSMPYLVPPPTETIRGGHPLDEQIHTRVPLHNMQTTFATPSSVMKAVWALLLSNALGSNDVVFGEVSANRHLSTLLGVDQVRGPCINFLPARARLDQGKTLASLIAQMQDQTTASLPYHHLGFRSIIKDCAAWPPGTRFSTAMVYQNHGSLNASLRIGDANCTLSNDGKLGDTADIWVIVMPGPKDLDIELRFSSHTFPSENVRWISRCLTMILEAIPSSLEQSLSQFKESLQSTIGPYAVLPNDTASLTDLLNGHPRDSSPQARDIVLQGWKELALLSEDESEDCSMFSCGADAVTAVLLSDFYHECGYDISVADIVEHPSRSMQACLVALKKMES